jgi:GxxExxY protein
MSADKESPDFLYVDITRKIIGSAFAVYKEFGYGFLEKVYENALLIELADRNLEAESQKPVAVAYKGTVVGNYLADISC